MAYSAKADCNYKALNLFAAVVSQNSTNQSLVVSTATVLLYQFNCTFLHRLDEVLG